jgi:hypothetical protein
MGSALPGNYHFFFISSPLDKHPLTLFITSSKEQAVEGIDFITI